MNALPVKPGELLADKYRVDRVLGKGGMGVVVAARYAELDEWVAIKCLLPEVAAHPNVVTRFLREARAAVKIRSEHVVRVKEVGRLANGLPYMVMEYLDGCDLGALVRTRGPLAIDEAVLYLLQACEALAEAHVQGIIHRDLKPQNLFRVHRADGSPCVKVLDFGIAKFTQTDDLEALTKTTGMMGSALYMSPEQLRAPKDVDARTDVWALGVILFELLTGEKPFVADALPVVVAQILEGEPIRLRTLRPEAPAELEAFIDRCLQKRREHRFDTVAALAAALRPFAGDAAQISVDRITKIMQRDPHSGPPPVAGVPVSMGISPMAGTVQPAAPAAVPIDRPNEPERRRHSPVWAVALAGAVVLAALGVGLSGRRHDVPPAASTASSASAPPPPTTTKPIDAVIEVVVSPPVPSVTPSSTKVIAVAAPKPAPSAAPSISHATPKPTAAPNCDPPTYVGDDGLQHFKAECK